MKLLSNRSPTERANLLWLIFITSYVNGKKGSPFRTLLPSQKMNCIFSDRPILIQPFHVALRWSAPTRSHETLASQTSQPKNRIPVIESFALHRYLPFIHHRLRSVVLWLYICERKTSASNGKDTTALRRLRQAA